MGDGQFPRGPLHAEPDQRFLVFNDTAHVALQCRPFVKRMLRLLQADIENGSRLELPGIQRPLHVVPVSVERDLALAVLVYLVHDPDERLAGIGHFLRERKIIFGLNMIVIGHIEHDISQVHGRFRRLPMGRIGRIDSGRIEQCGPIFQPVSFIVEIDPFHGLSVTAYLRQLFNRHGDDARLIAVPADNIGAPLAVANGHDVRACRDGTGRQQLRSAQPIDNRRFARRKMSAERQCDRAVPPFAEQIKHLPASGKIVCLAESFRRMFEPRFHGANSCCRFCGRLLCIQVQHLHVLRSRKIRADIMKTEPRLNRLRLGF